MVRAGVAAQVVVQVGQCPPGRRVVADLGFQFPDAAPQFQDAGIVRRPYVELFCEQPSQQPQREPVVAARPVAVGLTEAALDDPLVLHPEPGGEVVAEPHEDRGRPSVVAAAGEHLTFIRVARLSGLQACDLRC